MIDPTFSTVPETVSHEALEVTEDFLTWQRILAEVLERLDLRFGWRRSWSWLGWEAGRHHTWHRHRPQRPQAGPGEHLRQLHLAGLGETGGQAQHLLEGGHDAGVLLVTVPGDVLRDEAPRQTHPHPGPHVGGVKQQRTL